jgi:hypothetical protein
MYTQCDGVWNCLNGADEIGCDVFLPSNCSSDHHLCVSRHTNHLICISIKNANDGKIDCLGATDEPKLCRTKYLPNYQNNFYCGNITVQPCVSSKALCDGMPSCFYLTDDEQFCEKNRTFSVRSSICQPSYLSFASDVEKCLCNYTMNGDKQQMVYFSLDGMSKSVEHNVVSTKPTITPVFPHRYRCNRGLDLYVWMDDGNLKSICLCPPSFYGDRCQYQNQRVSLTLKFGVLSDSWKTLFAMVVSLIDDTNERIIHSYEQFSYLSIRDCKIKFQIYLVYSTRPKNTTKNYAIHIDIHEKVLLTYRRSFLFPIKFSFLPVHRLAFIVDIPPKNDKTHRCSIQTCVHGKCIRYANNLETFCRCDQG